MRQPDQNIKYRRKLQIAYSNSNPTSRHFSEEEELTILWHTILPLPCFEVDLTTPVLKWFLLFCRAGFFYRWQCVPTVHGDKGDKALL